VDKFLRVRRAALIVLGAVVFVAVSVLVGRWLTTESRERGLVQRLLAAQGRGDAPGMLAVLAPSCRRDARCRATVEADARRLRRPGAVKVIAYDSRTAYALGGATGLTRVAWTVVDRGLPVVQCVLVRRSGNAIAGRRITLLSVSAPIGNQSTC
jgi:hypothetical protein